MAGPIPRSTPSVWCGMGPWKARHPAWATGKPPWDGGGRDARDGTLLRTEWERDPDSKLLTRCPAGHAVVRHGLRTIEGEQRQCAYMSGGDCRECPLQRRCLARPGNTRGTGQFFIEDTPAIQRRDQRLGEQQRPDWRKKYAIRSGAESTNSELKRGHKLGHLRVRRAHRVRLAVTTKLIACNIKRWLRAVR